MGAGAGGGPGLLQAVCREDGEVGKGAGRAAREQPRREAPSDCPGGETSAEFLHRLGGMVFLLRPAVLSGVPLAWVETEQ